MQYDLDGFEPPKGSVVLSTTNSSTFIKCERKWGFEKIFKMADDRPRAALDFGSVLHLCLERYLLCPWGVVPQPEDAPDQVFFDARGVYAPGSVLEGQSPGAEVELFPRGWETYQDRDGDFYTVPDGFAQIIKKLVRKGIDQGVVSHLAHGRVERKFWLDLGYGVWATSLMDYSSESLNIVEDHKTMKNMKWAPTSSALAKDPQKKFYAVAMREWTGADTIHIAHNNFEKKGSNRVSKVRTEIHADEIDAHRELLLKQGLKMREYFDSASTFEDLTPNWSHCGEYGGCPFFSHCHKFKSLDSPSTTTSKTRYSQANVKVADNPMTPPKTTACTLCGDDPNGYMGETCPVCADSQSLPASSEPVEPEDDSEWVDAETEEPEEAEVEVEDDEDEEEKELLAKLAAKKKAKAAAAAKAKKEAEAEAKKKAIAEAKAKKAAASKAKAKKEEPEDEEEESEASDIPRHQLVPDDLLTRSVEMSTRKPANKRGRPAKSFTMLIGAMSLAPPKGVRCYHLRAVLNPILERYTEVHGHGYFDQPDDKGTFRRRDEVAEVALEIAEALGSDYLVVDPGDYEFAPLVSALKAYAYDTFVGVK